MGRIAKALDMAAHQDNRVEKDAIKNVPPLPEVEHTSGLSLKKERKEPEPLKSINRNWDKRLSKALNEDRSIPEVFKILRSRILHAPDADTVFTTILVTSAVPGEGKSFVAANLGVSIALGMDQHALLVDCDLRRPSLTGLFGLVQDKGLVDYLRDDAELSELIAKTEVQKLSLMASGEPPVNPAELLSSSRMRALVEELSRRYDDRIIIMDSPPMMVAAETSVLAGQVDGVILVVRQGFSTKEEIQKLINKIGKERIIGIVFNDHTGSVFKNSYTKRYGYYYQPKAT